MSDGRVEVEAVLNEAPLKKGVASVKADIKSIEDADRKLDWSGLQKGADAAKQFGDKLTSAGQGLTLKLTTPVLAAGVACATMSMNFDDAMAKVSTIADTTEVPLDDLRGAILKLSDDTGVAASVIADNVYNAISAGQSTGDAVNFVSNATKLATAGFTDSASALDLLSTTMNAYGMEADQVNRVSDVLLMTQNKGKTTVGELSQAMGKVIPTASAYGVSLENLAAAYATTTAKGIATAESTTYLSGMINELGDSGSDVGKIVKEKLGKSFKECMAEGMSLGEVLDACRQYADENGVSLNELFGSAEAGKAALAIAGDGIDGFTANLDAMNNASGATDEAFEKMQTDSWDLNKAINEIKNVMIEFGGTLVETLRPAIEGFISGVTAFKDWFASIGPEGQRAIIGIAAVAAAIGPLLVIVGSLAGAIGNIGSLIAGFGAAATGAGAAAGGMGASLGALLGPVALVVAAIAGVVAVVMYLWNTSEGFRNAVMGAWDAISSKVQEVAAFLMPYIQMAMTAIQQSVTTVMQAIMPVIDAAIQFVLSTVIPVVTSLMDTVGNVFAAILATITGVMTGVSQIISGALSVIQGIFQTVCGFIHGVVTGDFSQMQAGVESIMNGISNIVSGVWNTISSIFSGVINTIVSVVEGGFNAASSAISGVLDGIANTISNVMGGAKNTVSDAISAISGFFSGCKLELPRISLPHFSISGSFSLNPPSIPTIGVDWYATGGIFNAASIIGVGEAGPEAVMPLRGRNMQPFADAVAAGIGGGEARDVEVNIYVSATVREEADIERLSQAIAREFKRKELFA
jgi:TP901 family phage tail tape measure protein